MSIYTKAVWGCALTSNQPSSEAKKASRSGFVTLEEVGPWTGGQKTAFVLIL